VISPVPAPRDRHAERGANLVLVEQFDGAHQIESIVGVVDIHVRLSRFIETRHDRRGDADTRAFRRLLARPSAVVLVELLLGR
jgi:hypothetical protein